MFEGGCTIKNAVFIFIVGLTSFSYAHTEEPELGLLKDWGGAKTSLTNKGVEVHVIYKVESVSLLDGESKKKSTSLGNLDITADFDFEKLFGAQGWSLSLYGLVDHGGKPSEFVGDSFVTSNIEAPNSSKLYEAYIKKEFTPGTMALFGLRDLNADFYVTESSKPLLNSAFGISPVLAQTGPNGPSIFPVTAPALELRYETENKFYIQPAVFNALAGNPNHPKGTHVPDNLDEGTFSILETGYTPESAKYALGFWSYSKKVPQHDTSLQNKTNSGLYLLLEKGLSEKVTAFLRVGTAEKSVNTFSLGSEFGVGITGICSKRPDDILTFGVAHGEVSSTFIDLNGTAKQETVYEVAYKFLLYPGVYLTPDYQYISNPGLVKNAKAAQVGAIRAEIQF